ncbi:hypothetical protein N9W17_00285 [Jannaschia sp.]|nr:hypothetical protein [Jannaschia sp.]
MPHPNRVQPDGTFLASEARGTLTGNRGVLHDAQRQIGPARWKHRAWVCCALSFRGRHRDIMPPNRWTALFFLDEAVALAAGHRPCGFCRRDAYADFARAWANAFGTWPGPKAADTALHAARAIPGARDLRQDEAEADALPDGTLIRIDDIPHLIRGTTALPYTPQGYGPPGPRPMGRVTCLTNPVTRGVLAGGYAPRLHPSATG